LWFFFHNGSSAGRTSRYMNMNSHSNLSQPA